MVPWPSARPGQESIRFPFSLCFNFQPIAMEPGCNTAQCNIHIFSPTKIESIYVYKMVPMYTPCPRYECDGMKVMENAFMTSLRL